MSTLESIELARGLARCAADCFEALECLVEKRVGSLSIGVLAGHCAEAALKAHLALAGWSESRLKALGHDLVKCWRAANSAGLDFAQNPPKWVIGIGYSHSGLRYRYPKSWQEPWLPHPEDYMADLSKILEPLIIDFLSFDGKYVGEF